MEECCCSGGTGGYGWVMDGCLEGEGGWRDRLKGGGEGEMGLRGMVTWNMLSYRFRVHSIFCTQHFLYIAFLLRLGYFYTSQIK